MAIDYGVLEQVGEVQEFEPVGQAQAPTPFDRPAYKGRCTLAANHQSRGPALIPIARIRISRIAKWALIWGLLLLVAWLPLQLKPYDKSAYYLACAMGATTFAAIVATGFPRVLLPRIFGRWHEAAEAFRDWSVVGLGTGLLYGVGAKLLQMAQLPPHYPEGFTDYLMYRSPLMVGCASAGLLAACSLAVRREGLLDQGVLKSIGKVLIQALLVSVVYYWFYQGLESLYQLPEVVAGLGVAGQLCVLTTFSIITWAWLADRRLMQLQAQHRTTGVSGSEPMDLTLTVIGGRESGKTTLMAGAFYEWYTQDLGPLRIEPALDATRDSGASGWTAHKDDFDALSGGDLRKVAIDLYTHNKLPPGTVSCQDLPFDLLLDNQRVARFNLLDYPGGALIDAAPDPRDIEDFWRRAAESDAIVLIADMSHARRGQRDDDWMDVMNRYKTVLQLVLHRNGRNRVVPVALVLTKVDEFPDAATGGLDLQQLGHRFAEFTYDQLEVMWRRLNRESGPGFVEFSTWLTSAITYSQPVPGRDGQPDFTQPFEIAPPPPPITPSGCASPLLWITSKAMHWNVTLFWDLKSFVFGPSPQVRRHIKAVLELEALAEQRASHTAR